VREGSKGNEFFQTMQPQLARKQIAGWMELNTGTMTGRVMRVPLRDELDLNLNESLIVEYYSR
jgi:small subunit ribosomal protein S4